MGQPHLACPTLPAPTPDALPLCCAPYLANSLRITPPLCRARTPARPHLVPTVTRHSAGLTLPRRATAAHTCASPLVHARPAADAHRACYRWRLYAGHLAPRACAPRHLLVCRARDTTAGRAPSPVCRHTPPWLPPLRHRALRLPRTRQRVPYFTAPAWFPHCVVWVPLFGYLVCYLGIRATPRRAVRHSPDRRAFAGTLRTTYTGCRNARLVCAPRRHGTARTGTTAATEPPTSFGAATMV